MQGAIEFDQVHAVLSSKSMRFVRRYLERHPAAQMTLHQIDPTHPRTGRVSRPDPTTH